MHARYYDPNSGRFLSVDPVLAERALHDPQKWNPYTYVRNNPIRMTDPTGRDGVDGLVMAPMSYAADEGFVEADQSGRGAAYGTVGAVVVGALIFGAEYLVDSFSAPDVKEALSQSTRTLSRQPASWRGADPDDLRRTVPAAWPSTPSKKDGGERFVNPEKRGEGVRIMPGTPDARSPDHAGPYAKFTKDGKITHVPLKGNRSLPSPPPTEPPSLWKNAMDFLLGK